MARDAFKSPRAISGFHTGAQGLGHFILVVDDLDKSLDFYMKALGFRVSDFITLGASGPRLGFLHCNPRHHTLALLPIPNSPKRLNHIMLELKSVDDVVSTYDLCQQRQVPIVMSMGRHTNDRMMSFYMATPSGFMIEYGWGGRAVDDRTWQVQYHTAGSVWGHRFVGGNPPFSA
jgi:extradiol dioxygenase